MAESQNIEYKTSWDDDYLRWVCGFANAQGGRIYIGCDDDGNVVGVKGIKGLMESIPNKIKDTLGIMADINKKTNNKKDYIEIIVRPSSYPVSYNGEYHYRSGATKQQLRGAALTEFLMEKTGRRWEEVTVDDIGVDDLDDYSFQIFRREALRKRRMTEDDLNVSNGQLLDRLNLITNGKLKRAAVLLFYHNPEKIVTGCHVKIGKFGEGADLLYQDMMDGSVMQIADRTLNLIFEKYLKAWISYEHDRRIETYPFPREGVREAIFNALAHNCYSDSIPIQIRIEDHVMYIRNNCRLPQGWTVKTLMQPHKSEPYNPIIAGVFYRAGFIESWGRGIEKICDACAEYGSPKPKYSILGHGITVEFCAHPLAVELSRKENKGPKGQGTNVLVDGALNGGVNGGIEKDIIALMVIEPTIRVEEISRRTDVPKRTVERKIRALREDGKVIRAGGGRYGRWVVNDG